MKFLEMSSVEFSRAHRVDLAAALTGISGVTRVEFGNDLESIRVEYDPMFVSPALLRKSVKEAGYGVESMEEQGPERAV